MAYWQWNTATEQQTNVVFTVTQSYSCAADGGGNISHTDVSLAPTSCTDTQRAIKRQVKLTPTINKDGLSINFNLWLNINELGEGLSNSTNFKYVLTTSNTSCEEGTIISSGTFNNEVKGNMVSIIDKDYNISTTDTYWLYIWLDKEETSSSTMNQRFNFSLGGSCTDYEGKPEKPVLDPGMIPVTIANNGKVTTVSSDDPNWYDYDNKEWANVVLVKERGINTRTYYQTTKNIEVEEEDILAYYVWIPRYKYRIYYPQCSEIPESERNQEDYPYCYGYSLNIDYEEFRNRVSNAVIDNIGYGSICLYSDYDYGEIIRCSDEELNKMLHEGYLSDNSTIYITEILSEDEYEYVYLSNAIGNRNQPTSIDILFESSNSPALIGNAQTQYRTHPAFWWDHNRNSIIDNNETLSGIWISKFKTSKTDSAITVLPNKQKQASGETTIRSIANTNNIYGLNSTQINSHMMKNRDWGAAAYLSHSKYGLNDNIEINSTELTGGATETSLYGTLTSYPQSTTGNITGIFDMAGFPESVANTFCILHNDGSSSSYYDGNNCADSKYYDTYTFPISDVVYDEFGPIGYMDETRYFSNQTIGHAMHEMFGWYNGTYDNISLEGPYVMRGRGIDLETDVISMFSFTYTFGSLSNLSFERVILINGFSNED